ncbi:unnamed protein product, partial [Iphiclides podalirius]
MKGNAPVDMFIVAQRRERNKSVLWPSLNAHLDQENTRDQNRKDKKNPRENCVIFVYSQQHMNMDEAKRTVAEFDARERPVHRIGTNYRDNDADETMALIKRRGQRGRCVAPGMRPRPQRLLCAKRSRS